MILEERHLLLYSALRPRLNQILVYIRDELSVCDYAPEINVLLKDQSAYYIREDDSLPTIPQMGDHLMNAMKKNTDGTLNKKGIKLRAPVYSDIHKREFIFSL